MYKHVHYLDIDSLSDVSVKHWLWLWRTQLI